MDTAILVKGGDDPKKWTAFEKKNPGNRTVDKMGQDMVELYPVKSERSETV